MRKHIRRRLDIEDCKGVLYFEARATLYKVEFGSIGHEAVTTYIISSTEKPATLPANPRLNLDWEDFVEYKFPYGPEGPEGMTEIIYHIEKDLRSRQKRRSNHNHKELFR
jgi:hypothetical protein